MKLAVFSAKSYDRTYFDQVREQHFPELCTIEYQVSRWTWLNPAQRSKMARIP
jgi:hypothetical protein